MAAVCREASSSGTESEATRVSTTDDVPDHAESINQACIPANSDETEVPFEMIPKEIYSFDGPADSRASLDDLLAELRSLQDEQQAHETSVKQYAGEMAPEHLLQKDVATGLSDKEAKARLIFGLNQLPEEKSSLLKNLVSYIVGPIQFVMMVSNAWSTNQSAGTRS